MAPRAALSSSIRLLASLRLTTFALAYLAILVVWGTVFQARYGLHAAQVKIFQSWFFSAAGFLPLPGVLTIGAILAVNLLAVSLFKLKYGWRRLGLILIHYGLLLLLVGCFYSGRFSHESYLTLFEGESSGSSSSYHDWELSVSSPAEPGKPLQTLDPALIPVGQSHELPSSGTSIQLLAYFGNCLPRVDGSRIAGLRPRPAEIDPADNRPGCRFALVQNSARIGEFFLWSGSHRPHVLAGESGNLQLRLQPRRIPMPFIVKLVDFRKSYYPGTEIARSFESQVEITSSGSRHIEVISMNRPMRRQGFTLYQSSYGENNEGMESSTFAVVKNRGRLLPYIATIMTFLGLALHFLLRLPAGRRKNPNPK